MKTKRYVEFDGLRGLLAMWVALAHLICWCGYGRLAGTGKVGKLWEVFTGADAAAEAFIILSGFAIATLLQNDRAGYGRYMMRRAFRIYPVYIVCLGLAIWLAPATGMLIQQMPWTGDYYLGWQATAQAAQDANPDGHIWAHVFLLHGLLPKAMLEGVSVTYLMPAWSIGLEEQFYLAAPLLLWMLHRGWGLVAVLLLAVAGQVFQSQWNNPMNASLPFWLPFFLVGIGSSYVARWVQQSDAGADKMSAALAFGPLVLAAFISKTPLPFLIWGTVFPVALGAWKSFAPRTGRLISAALCHPAAQWLGNISYSVYLLHWPVIIMLLGMLHRYQPGMPQAWVFGYLMTVGVAVILVVSWAMHAVIEQPFIVWGRRLANRGDDAEKLPELPSVMG